MKLFGRMALLICTLTAWMTLNAAASQPEYPTGTSGEAVWTLKDGTIYVTGTGIFSGASNADSQPWEYFEDQIRHVVVEDGVTVIGDLIFAHTYNLETVTIADSVTQICEGAFRNCYALRSVKLPAKLQELDDFVFAYCEKLESIELPDTLTKMGGSVFTGCSSLASVKLPQTLYDIQQMNFDSCMSLTEVTIPAGVGFLRHASFPNCFNLKKVVFEGNQPHTNGDPFYMGPEDLTVYCYRDAEGWDDTLFYTYPVVKLDRPEEKPEDEPTVVAPEKEPEQEERPDGNVAPAPEPPKKAKHATWAVQVGAAVLLVGCVSAAGMIRRKRNRKR